MRISPSSPADEELEHETSPEDSGGAASGQPQPDDPRPAKGTHEWLIKSINVISHPDSQHPSSAAGLEASRMAAINIDEAGGCAAPG